MKTKKNPDDIRSNSARIRLSKIEIETLRELAKATGLTISEFMRSAALGRQVEAVRVVPEINRATYSELGRISGNLQRLFTFAATDKRLPEDFSKSLAGALMSIKTECRKTQTLLIGTTFDSAGVQK